MMRELNRFTWAELAALDPGKLTYLLPISALEQHGRHLPLGTDDFILQAVLDALRARPELSENLLCLPVVHYGNSHEHLHFPGTLSLRCATIAAAVGDVLSCMQAQGVKRLAVLNSHGGNTALFSAMAQEWEYTYGVQVFAMSLWTPGFFAGTDLGLDAPENVEIHAGEVETSMLEYAFPDVVRRGEITPERDNPVVLKPYYDGWDTAVLSPDNGQLGMASKASPEKGARLVQFAADKFCRYLVDIQNAAALK
jgi:creatinine amidohydrolase